MSPGSNSINSAYISLNFYLLARSKHILLLFFSIRCDAIASSAFILEKEKDLTEECWNGPTSPISRNFLSLLNFITFVKRDSYKHWIQWNIIIFEVPGLGNSFGEGNGNPLQYSCLENPMDRGAWQATVHGVTESWTWLSDQHSNVNMSQVDHSCDNQVSRLFPHLLQSPASSVHPRGLIISSAHQLFHSVLGLLLHVVSPRTTHTQCIRPKPFAVLTPHHHA